VLLFARLMRAHLDTAPGLVHLHKGMGMAVHGAELSDWAAFGVQNLARAYGDDEPEYTVSSAPSPPNGTNVCCNASGHSSKQTVTADAKRVLAGAVDSQSPVATW